MRLCTAFHCIVLLTANKFLSSLSVSSQSANVGETMRGDAALRANDTAYCWFSMSAASQSSYRWGVSMALRTATLCLSAIRGGGFNYDSTSIRRPFDCLSYGQRLLRSQ